MFTSYSIVVSPICEALGIDYKVQWQKLKDDEDLI